eukprot:TRINITY_DN88104_c0_g1_i1.p3 TRINITY_DN88104_c0_g1~~TRINITY_DN88104_c0_g1_i1.p3  ORF type:complete len:289 (+),score=32.38 TRINITY_DN88104_c0_g1_i1:1393-2259(+)
MKKPKGSSARHDEIIIEQGSHNNSQIMVQAADPIEPVVQATTELVRTVEKMPATENPQVTKDNSPKNQTSVEENERAVPPIIEQNEEVPKKVEEVAKGKGVISTSAFASKKKIKGVADMLFSLAAGSLIQPDAYRRKHKEGGNVRLTTIVMKYLIQKDDCFYIQLVALNQRKFIFACLFIMICITIIIMLCKDSVCAKCLNAAPLMKRSAFSISDEAKEEEQFCAYCTGKHLAEAVCFFMGSEIIYEKIRATGMRELRGNAQGESKTLEWIRRFSHTKECRSKFQQGF